MAQPRKTIRAWSLLFWILPCFSLFSASPENPELQDRPDWPGLRWLDASYLRDILREQPGLLKIGQDKKTSLLWAKTVSLQRKVLPGQDFPGKDGPWYLFYTPFDPSRWDLLVNGAIIDPRNYLLEYGGKIVNLALLFTYREEMASPDRYPAWNF